ncbi:MAG: flagellar hook assembly protein FlgD [Proteobacteria bacterium]|nr:flagellar hook assembly protein FlgD [Pseudomonadota bacterium]
MTETNATSGAANGAITSIATGGKNSGLNEVNFDTFLKLLVSQLKNQDPLNPLDGTQFTGQIAQFSSLEQQINGNNYLKEIVSQRDYGQQNLATGYIGKDILGPGNALVKDGGGVSFGYNLDGVARGVDIEIIDSRTGETMRTMQGETEAGRHVFNWDGKTDRGQNAPNGQYTLRVSAFNGEGKVVASQPYAFGRVDSVLNDGKGGASLLLEDGRNVELNKVVMVRG